MTAIALDTMNIPDADLPRGSELVLVVDDNEALAALATRTLQRLGYRVIAVTNGARANALPAGILSQVELLLTDIVMPEMNGVRLVEQFLKREFAPAIVYMSGYCDAMAQGETADGRPIHFLPKPWSARALAQVARRALDCRTVSSC
jgi:two-component system cell cycle sensor histidine kinase/response regulator CckA